MSLLNDTLRDLEHRREKEGNDEATSGYGHLVASPQSDTVSAKTVLIMVSVVLIAVLATAVWYYLPRKASGKISTDQNSSALNSISRIPQKTEPVLVAQPGTKILSSAPHNKSIVVIPRLVKPLQQPVNSIPPAVPAYKVKQGIVSAPAIHKVDAIKIVTVVVPVKTPKRVAQQAKKFKGILEKTISLTPLQRDLKNVDKAKKLLRSGKEKEAHHLLYTFINQHPVNQQSRILLVSLLIQQRDYSEVSTLLPSGKVDKSVPLRLLKARWFLSQGERKTALALLQSDPPRAIDGPDYLALMAVLYQQARDYRRSVKIYGELLEFFPDKADWWVGLGASLERLPDIKNAQRAYQKALILPGLKAPLRKYAEVRLKKLLR